MPVLDATDVNAVWAKDVDPGATTYSASGVLWVLYQRFPTNMVARLDAIDTALATINTKLDNMNTLPAADIAYIKSAVDTITADPAVSGTGHPIVAAVNYAETH